MEELPFGHGDVLCLMQAAPWVRLGWVSTQLRAQVEDVEFVWFPDFGWGMLTEEVIVNFFFLLVCSDCVYGCILALEKILLECLSHVLKPSRIWVKILADLLVVHFDLSWIDFALSLIIRLTVHVPVGSWRVNELNCSFTGVNLRIEDVIPVQ